MRIPIALAVLLVGLSAVWVTRAVGDSWLPPRPRIFASQDGSHGFKVVPSETNATATLFTLTDTGEEKTEWQGRLVNIPHQVFVSSTGPVVTVDTYARVGYEHALVVYSPAGEVRADYRLEELLTPAEITAHVLETAGSRWWNADARFSFSPDGETFVVTLSWGKVIVVDLKTGKLLPPL